MTSSPAPDLEELERLAKAATQTGLWDHVPATWYRVGARERTVGPVIVGVADQRHGGSTVRFQGSPATEDADAAYIVALHNTAPALLTELRAAREAAAESGRLREALRAVMETVGFPVHPPSCDCPASVARNAAAALLATPPAPSDHGAGERE